MSQTGWIQNADVKSEADLIAQGATRASLPDDTKIYISAFSSTKLLYEAIAQRLLQGTPLLIHANPAGADSKLYIESSQVPTLEGMTKFPAPSASTVLLYPATSIDFAAQSSAGGPVSIAWPTTVAGQYYRMALAYLASTNTVRAVFSPGTASQAALADPGTLFVTMPGALALGYVDLLALDGVGHFKTANSAGALSLIENQNSGSPNVFIAVGGGGSSGGGGGSGGMFAGQFSIAAPTAMDSTLNGKILLVNSSVSGPFNITMPPKTSGYYFTVKDVGQALSTNAVTLVQNADGAALEFVSGGYLLDADGGSWTWYCDGTQWLLI